MTVIKPIKAKRLRVVRENTCGVAQLGVTGQIVSDGFIKVEFSFEYEDGEEFIVKNGNGDLCINQKDPDRLKRIGVKITLCEVDPAAIEMMLGARLISVTGEPTGFALSEDANTAKVGLELWNGVAGDTCSDEGDEQFIHWALPMVENLRMGDMSHEYGPVQVELSGNTRANANYGSGPFDLWTPDLGNTEHVAAQITDVAPPAAADGYQELEAA